LVLFRHQLIANDPPVDRPKARTVTSIDHLLRRSWIKVYCAFDRENQDSVPAFGQLKCPIQIPNSPDGIVMAL
jgi:hypothetical protein